MQPEAVQLHCYLIYEGGFGCRAGWHVGLIQEEGPGGERKKIAIIYLVYTAARAATISIKLDYNPQ